MNHAFRLPAEWEPQAGVLLAWPHADTDWAERLADVETTCTALVAAIARFERVLLCVGDADVHERAHTLLKNAGADLSRIEFIDIEYDDTWSNTRCCAPLLGSFTYCSRCRRIRCR